jgi:hypothetical protein
MKEKERIKKIEETMEKIRKALNKGDIDMAEKLFMLYKLS